jgi:signal transduction histidine kinase
MPSHEVIDTHQEPISVSSDVLARLGEELITNHVQALAELIKNAYDADATSVEVDVDTSKIVVDDGGRVRGGAITIADNGFGMDEDAVRGGWLRVSASPKRAMKDRGERTPRKRTPLGDKGLGRLGAQRLGDRVRIRTRPQDGSAKEPAAVEHDVAFAFSDFSSEKNVTDITVPWRTLRLPEQADLTEPWIVRKPSGTIIEISGLANPKDWVDLKELERSLSLLVNPFKGIERFDVSVTVDGHRLLLQSVADAVRDAALSRWEGTFDGETLTLDGNVRLQWFNVRDRQMQERLQSLIAADGGAGLRDHVIAAAKKGGFAAAPARKPWLIKLHRTIKLEDLDQTGLMLEDESEDALGAPNAAEGSPAAGDVDTDDKPGKIVSPGDFLLELDLVSRRIGVARAGGFSALDRQAEYTKWLNERGGVHVYRDGFRINLGSDVMDLGEGFSKRGSYYGVRPANVVGYIEISARDNPGLEETTDREGFRETPEVATFRRLIHEVRDQINDQLEALGRAAGDYIREQMAPGAPSTEELAEELEEAADEAAKARRAVAAAAERVRTVLVTAAEGGERDAALESAVPALAAAEAALVRVAGAQELGQVVRHDVAALSERVEEYAQLIGLGLVAETMAHELNHVSARLTAQIRDLESRRSDLEPWARVYLQETRSALDALHGQLRHLDPMLRYARTRRDRIDLGSFTAEMVAYHGPRLADVGIDLTLETDEPAAIMANRGRLMQVFDNIIINSEYWLAQALDAKRIKRGLIVVRVEGSTMTFSDNGPGVDRQLERSIFDPFVTAKADRGRGLGLFISRQLLDMDGASIELGESRNAKGRADTFEVSFDGIARAASGQ